MVDKREMIERVVAEYVITGSLTEQVKWDALAEQAIVIECEVEHDNDEYCPLTSIEYSDVESRDTQVLDIRGTHGNRGKAIAIILSLEKENNGETC